MSGCKLPGESLKEQGVLRTPYAEQFLWMLIIYLRGRIKHIKGASGDCPSSIDNPPTFNELESQSRQLEAVWEAKKRGCLSHNSLLEHGPDAFALLGPWSTCPHLWGRSGLRVQAVPSPGASCSPELSRQLLPTHGLWLEKLNIFFLNIFY